MLKKTMGAFDGSLKLCVTDNKSDALGTDPFLLFIIYMRTHDIFSLILLLKVQYKELPIGYPLSLPPISYVEGQDVYMVEIPGLYPGGAYGVMVQAWQNVSGEYAGSSIQQVNATTSKWW